MVIFKSKFDDVTVPEVSLPEYILSQMKNFGDSVALVDGSTGYSITYDLLGKLIFTAAKNLYHEFEVKNGEVFAIMLPNHPLYAVLFQGVGLTGAANTTINPLYTAEEIRKQLKDSGSKWITTINLFKNNVLEGIKGTDVKTVFILDKDPVPSEKLEDGVQVMDMKVLLKPPKDTEPIPYKINPKEDLIVLPYSSGTTGVSKGVCLTHYNLLSNIFQIDLVEKFTQEDTIVGLLPFFHIYGMNLILNTALKNGAKVVTMPKFDFLQFLKILESNKVSRAHLVPPIILAMAKQEAIVSKFDLSALKVITSGAAPLSGGLVKMAAEKTNTIIKQGYGMTESSPVLTVQEDETAMKYVQSCGILVPNTLLKVVDEQSKKDLGPNETGELCFKGPQVMKGYLNNVEATKSTIIDGWLHTGDVGHIDENGNVYVTDRLKELIKYKGYQVPPAELEAVLLKNEDIVDAAVIGVEDLEAGELPKAFVVRKEGSKMTEEDVMLFVAGHVAPQKKVRLVEFVDSIPKSSAGKILRRLLRKNANQ